MSSVGLLVTKEVGLFMQNNVGSRFKNIRKSLKMSQENLAKLLGITKQAVSNIENSKSMPSIAIMNKLINEHNININYLIAEKGDMFFIKDKNYKALRNSLLKEVDEFLKARGV